MSEFFAHPMFLQALVLVLPAGFALWYLGYFQRRRQRKQYGDERLIDSYSVSFSKTREYAVCAAWMLVLILLLVAAAGPLAPAAPQTARAGSLQVVAVTDVSWSMGTEDYRPTMDNMDGTPCTAVAGSCGSRLDLANQVLVNKVMPAIEGNELGVVTFMGDGFTQSDLTDDYNALGEVVSDWVTTGDAPGGGSDVAAGLNQALLVFARDPQPKMDKVVIVFTDGGFTSDPAALTAVTQKLVADHVRVIVCGMGLSKQLPVPLYDAKGNLIGYRAYQQKEVLSSIDQASLRQLAQDTDGTYIHIKNLNDANQIHWASKLAGSKVVIKTRNLYRLPLALALLLILGLSLRGLLPAATGFRS